MKNELIQLECSIRPEHMNREETLLHCQLLLLLVNKDTPFKYPLDVDAGVGDQVWQLLLAKCPADLRWLALHKEDEGRRRVCNLRPFLDQICGNFANLVVLDIAHRPFQCRDEDLVLFAENFPNLR